MRKAIILLVFIFFSIQILAQIKSDIINIGVFKNQYSNTDTISIFLKNKVEQKIFLGISLEKKIQNNWIEVSHDIFKRNEFAKIQNIIILTGKENKIEKWVPVSVLKNKKKLVGWYRFKFQFSSKPLDFNNVITSSKFFLK